jgi:uncharacterized repeat protein (TIGR03803 family)
MSRRASNRHLARVALRCAFALITAVIPAQAGISLTAVYSFDGTNGRSPLALVQSSDGNFYGTAHLGGIGYVGQEESGNGTVFRLAGNGTFTTTVWLGGVNGSAPANLIMGVDGHFYGTTFNGTNGWGSLFQLNSDGSMANPNLGPFDGSTHGSLPVGLVQDRDGVVYGVTENSWPGQGTLFKIDTNGVFTTLTQFYSTNGVYPGALLRGKDGSLYGVTMLGGASNLGAVFKATSAGDLFNVFSFDTNNPSPSWLIQCTDGDLYGTTADYYYSGTGYGTVFRMTTNGSLVWSFAFNGTNGSKPVWLMQATDGNLYGTTQKGGNGYTGVPNSGNGTIFKMTPGGSLTTLAALDGANGANPFMLIQATDGDFYGTAEKGGTNHIAYGGDGTIFRLTFRPPPAFTSAARTGNSLALTWSAVTGLTYQVQFSTNLLSPGWSNLGGTVVATNETMLTTDTIGVGPRRFYRIVLFP